MRADLDMALSLNPTFYRRVKNAQMQGADIICRERFQTISYDVGSNKPAPCLTRGRMRGGIATKKERLFATPACRQVGVFFNSLLLIRKLGINLRGAFDEVLGCLDVSDDGRKVSL